MLQSKCQPAIDWLANNFFFSAGIIGLFNAKHVFAGIDKEVSSFSDRSDPQTTDKRWSCAYRISRYEFDIQFNFKHPVASLTYNLSRSTSRHNALWKLWNTGLSERKSNIKNLSRQMLLRLNRPQCSVSAIRLFLHAMLYKK